MGNLELINPYPSPDLTAKFIKYHQDQHHLGHPVTHLLNDGPSWIRTRAQARAICTGYDTVVDIGSYRAFLLLEADALGGKLPAGFLSMVIQPDNCEQPFGFLVPFSRQGSGGRLLFNFFPDKLQIWPCQKEIAPHKLREDDLPFIIPSILHSASNADAFLWATFLSKRRKLIPQARPVIRKALQYRVSALFEHNPTYLCDN